jgi:Domain of unknown function (DU1801)
VERSSTTPDQHIASLPDGVREDIAALDAVIAQVMAGQERVLWEGTFWGGSSQHIVGYGSYRYRGRSGAEGEWFVVGLAAQKSYLSLYVNGAENGTTLAKRYGPTLGKVKAGSGNIQFKRAADLDLDALREMVTRARELAPGPG